MFCNPVDLGTFIRIHALRVAVHTVIHVHKPLRACTLAHAYLCAHTGAAHPRLLPVQPCLEAFGTIYTATNNFALDTTRANMLYITAREQYRAIQSDMRYTMCERLTKTVTRDITGSHGYVTRTRFFFLFPISPLFPSRDLGPTVPLHGPALYHMT